jgi:CheY-like chemotaxis protein
MLILLADDDPVQTSLLTARLKRRGYAVSTAVNAIHTWMVAVRRPPDAIILDIQMPGGTGYAVLKQMKSSSKTMRIPVIVLSGSIDERDRAKLKELGADEFLSKPVDLEKLFATLAKLLGPEGVRAKEATPSNLPLAPKLDAGVLLNYVGGDIELLRELVGVFWTDCPRMLGEIKTAMTESSPNALEIAAHAFKGSLGYFGPSSALQAVQQLEKLGHEGRLEGAGKSYSDLEKGLAELKPALDALQKESAA